MFLGPPSFSDAAYQLSEQAYRFRLRKARLQLNLCTGAAPVFDRLHHVKSRFYAVWASGRHHVKKVALFLSSNIDEYYDGIIFAHLNAAEALSLESMGVFTSYGAQNKSEEKLEELRAFGRSL